jgi:hypothetical protein
VLEATYPIWHDGLSRHAYARFGAAQMKTAWGRGHRRRFVLVDGTDVLASTMQYNLAGESSIKSRVRVCGIGAVFTAPAPRVGGCAGDLVERLWSKPRASRRSRF